MKLTISYFASVKASLGISKEVIEVDETQIKTLSDVRQFLAARSAKWQNVLSNKRLRLAIDYSIVSEKTAIHEGAEVAFLPPVSGG